MRWFFPSVVVAVALSVEALGRDHLWPPPAIPSEDGAAAAEMLVRLQTIRIPKLEFARVPPMKAIEVLRAEISRLDPALREIAIEFSADVAKQFEMVAAAPRSGVSGVVTIDFTAENLSLADAFGRMAEEGNILARVTATGVKFSDYGEADETLLTQVIPLPPEIFGKDSRVADFGINPEAMASLKKGLRKYFVDRGYEADSRGEFRFDQNQERITLRDTGANIEDLCWTLGALIAPPVPGPETAKEIVDPAEGVALTLSEPGDQVGREMLREFVLEDGTVAEAVDRLRQLITSAKDSTPDRGPEIQLAPESGDAGRRFAETKVTLRLSRTTLLAAARAIVQQAGGVVLYDGETLILASSREAGPAVVTREYRVPPSMSPLKELPSADQRVELLDRTGAEGGDSISTVYLSRTQTLLVSNTAAQHEKMQRRIDEAWKLYYASKDWPLEQQRQQRVRGLFPQWKEWKPKSN